MIVLVVKHILFGEKKMKHKTKIIGTIVILSVGIILSFSGNTTPVIDKSQIKSIALIEYPAEYNYRQTINDCGPFNTAAIVRALKKTKVDSKSFAEEIKWRLPNKYTLPWGIEKQLEENGIVMETPDVETLTNEDKIFFLQEQISLGKPIVILGGRDNYQHYVSIFGFDSSKNEFYIYDSLLDKNLEVEGLTIDENGDLPGNKTFFSADILEFWNKGGMYGLYRWYAIVASA